MFLVVNVILNDTLSLLTLILVLGDHKSKIPTNKCFMWSLEQVKKSKLRYIVVIQDGASFKIQVCYHFHGEIILSKHMSQ